MALNLIIPTTEELGRRRFPDGAEFLRLINDSSDRIRQRLLQSLASNYPKTAETNIGVLYTAAAEEFARLSYSLSNIHEDKFHGTTRQEYLFQILGDNLFLAEKSINHDLSGEEYRSFLLKIRNAYFGGSRKKNIENVLSDILGVDIVLTELFEEARKPGSIYTTKDTHKVFFDIFMDEASPTDNIGLLIQDLIFFINLIRPSHVLYKTRFIWKEDYDLNKRVNLSFGRDTNGVTPEYDYTASSEVVVSVDKVSLYTGTESSLVETSWESGTISSLDLSNKIILLTNGRKLVFGESTTFYDRDVDGDFRIEAEDLTISGIRYLGVIASGFLKFHNVPEEVQTNTYKQFDPKVMEKPYFQENVKKVYDIKGRFEKSDKEQNTTVSSKKVVDTLVPMYEDMRDNCELPSAKAVSDIFYTVNLEAGSPGDLPAYLIISDSPNSFKLTNTPVLSESGGLASPEDLLLFINGIQVFDSISNIDVLSGDVTLDYLVPSNSQVQINYWFSKKYPALTEFSYSWPLFSNLPSPSNLPATATVIESYHIVKRLNWPFIVTDLSLYGQDTDYQINKFPLLDRLGNLASVEDIRVFLDGVEMFGAVSYVRPLLGHVGLYFIPPQGTVIKFKYYFTSQKRTYAFVPDNISYPSDAIFGNRYTYTSVVDVDTSEGVLEPLFYSEQVLKIGYRWRAFDLSASSVLNSKDTLVVNGINKEFNKATILNSPNRLNLSKVTFSPEHLKDKSKSLVLNDLYLENDLTPELSLHRGTPPFIKTFTDGGSFSAGVKVEEADSTFVEGTDLQASMTVLAVKEDNGLVEYNGISSFREKKKLSRYSGLRVIQKSDGGIDVPITSLCDDRNISTAFGFPDEYFPDRELRTDNYLDFNRFETVILFSGTAKFINGSDIIKSLGTNWSGVSVGNTFNISSLNLSFEVLSVINKDTIKLSSIFSELTGSYGYEIVTEPRETHEVSLSKATRRVVIDGLDFFFPDPDPDPTPINPGFSSDPVYDGYPVDDPTSTDYRKRNASKLYKQDQILDYDQVSYVVAGPSVSQTNPIGSISNSGGPGISSTGNVRKSWDEFVEGPGGDLEPRPISFGINDSEVLRRVRWRNWDQDLAAVSLGTIEETNISIMDDLGEGIKKFYWNVSTQQLEEHLFFGSVIETSSLVSSLVSASSYPDGLILITNPDVLINPAANGLNDVNYQLRDTIIRELIQDGTLQINIIQEFIRL